MASEKDTTASQANSMWGGRFAAGPAEIMEQINASIDFDKILYAQDIQGSKAHCQMLMDQKIISGDDGAAILKGLDQVKGEIEAGNFTYDAKLEDIHMHVETRLKEIIGDAAGRLHTARSRNDQVATDFKLWVRDTMDQMDQALKMLQTALVTKAEQHADVILPGFTHLQSAQPVTFGHHMLAYFEMFTRDRDRLRDARGRLNECPLGAAALAGTSFPIDRTQTAEALNFRKPTANSLDSVSDRDFALEFLSVAAISATHVSRLAEEIVIWSSAQFNFVSLSDQFTTGSSIMPQKRNPDAAELCRAKAGRIIGALNSLLVVMKGLPLAYSKDMQEDKEATFDAARAYALVITAMSGMVDDMTVNAAAMKASTAAGFITATDLADWLVRVLDMPFRNAHHVTGSLVALAEKKGCDLDGLTLAEMQTVESRITDDVFSVLTVESSVASRVSYGGTAPSQVLAQVENARRRIE
ncbi:argininosuccinate lyase [Paremcibacter congregatus]|uniref:Argininosuccinate lyase n=1 Tax=Paremcibacter congregatus TaxID=2043170 RepID=A0A2G4YPW9_9PROT|nr:argininosuccinate lyase [Paremcibacter congregatus]PHZ84374.1 argininosuccinate lyase [Paremcibacter congregatus]QDE28593.1 argininosuccinate lyase [Paremcibacter congregatus]